MKALILKNMEALFIASLIIAGTTTFAAAKIPAVTAHKAVQADSTMHTVTVSAKRLTAEEKAAD